jgi:hypothetical protein
MAIAPDRNAALLGTHCAGVGCEHDELAGSGLEPVAPHARTSARHRRAASGRRVRVVALQAIHAEHANHRNALLG